MYPKKSRNIVGDIAKSTIYLHLMIVVSTIDKIQPSLGDAEGIQIQCETQQPLSLQLCTDQTEAWLYA